MLWVVAALALAFAPPPKPPPLVAPPGRRVTTPPPSEAEWQAAEAVVVAHYRTHGHPHVEVSERFARWPFLFRLFVDDSWRAYELVFGGKVVTERGLKALARQLEALGGWDGAPPSVAELLELVHVLDAWPPVAGVPGYPEPTGYVAGNDLDVELPAPALQHEPGVMRLVLHYRLLDAGQTGDPVRLDDGPPDGPRLMEVGRWELALRRGKTPVWTETRSSRVRG